MKENKSETEIVLVLDSKYEKFATLFVRDILRYARKNTQEYLILNILTFEDFVPRNLISKYEKDFKKIRHFSFNTNVFSAELEASGHISRVAYLKIFIGSVLPETSLSCIYFDVDILVNDNPNELFELALPKECLIAASTRYGRQTHHQSMNKLDKTFNSGLMKINLDVWRKLDFTKVCMEILIKEGGLPWADNDILVLALNRLDVDCFHLNSRIHFMPDFIGKNELGDSNPIFVHFLGANKPWNSPFGSQFAKLWRKRFKDIEPNFKLDYQVYLRFCLKIIRDIAYKSYLPVIETYKKLISN